MLTEDLGLVPGNRVLLRGPNNPWLVACWFGVLRAGGVVVTAMPLLRAHELSTLCAISPARRRDHRPPLRRRAARPPTPAERRAPCGAPPLTTWSARCAAKRGVFTAVDTAADDVALIGFTSGTTGKPKPTMHFHRDVLANSDTFARHIVKPRPDDLFTGTPPIGFTFGLGGLVVFPLHVGAATLLLEQVTPEQLAELIAAYEATVLFTADRPTGRSCRADSPTACPGCGAACRRGGAARLGVGGVPQRDRAAHHRRDEARRQSAAACCISAADAGGVRPGARPARPVPGIPRRGPRRRRARAVADGAARLAGRQGPDRVPLPGRRAARSSTYGTAGTSPGTPTSATSTAISGTRHAVTT
ncbi:AMP-binding protein [Yinghuangia aomiensis]